MEQHSDAFQKQTMKIILGAIILTAVLILWSLIQNAFQPASDGDLDVPNTNRTPTDSPGILTGWKPFGTTGGGLFYITVIRSWGKMPVVSGQIGATWA
jgi:hypothetical protein